MTALGKQRDWPTRTKTAAALDDGSNKTRLEDMHLDEEKEGERRFAVNLEAMDIPLRGKGSSHIHEGKKVLETTLTTTGTEKTTKKMGKKALFAKAASAPAPEAAKKPGFLYRKFVVCFVIRIEKGQKSKENFDKKVGKALTFLKQHNDPEACFLPIKLEKNLGPIKDKADLPKFQVTSR